jgi:hypothetical protein
MMPDVRWEMEQGFHKKKNKFVTDKQSAHVKTAKT